MHKTDMQFRKNEQLHMYKLINYLDRANTCFELEFLIEQVKFKRSIFHALMQDFTTIHFDLIFKVECYHTHNAYLEPYLRWS